MEEFDRREFIKKLLIGGTVLSFNSLGCFTVDELDQINNIPIKISGSSSEIGHLIRDKESFPSPTRTIQTKVLIIGGGIAGLSAGRKLSQLGISDYLIVDLEPEVGGNSMGGSNSISKFPRGAHYLPIPNLENKELLAFLEESGIITSWSSEGLPEYSPEMICHSPESRLLIHGKWQDGIIPRYGVSSETKEEIDRFFAEMDGFRELKSPGNHHIFTIPMAIGDYGSWLTKLDSISMKEWCTGKEYNDPYLLWYLNYCSQDDYGTTIEKISAWAGVHYFASRRGISSNASKNGTLTWPEGNYFLVKKLKKGQQARIKTNHLAVEINDSSSKPKTVLLNPKDKTSIQIESEKVIFSGPGFITKYLLPQAQNRSHPSFQYIPWITANISIKNADKILGNTLSWDNVKHGGKSLGYIRSRHQELLGHRPKQEVITWYCNLDGLNPREIRAKLSSQSKEELKKVIIDDLRLYHANLVENIVEIDLWIWGHGMINPSINFLSSKELENARKPIGNVHFAHSDLSGISIFEEAFYWGNRAAESVFKGIDK